MRKNEVDIGVIQETFLTKEDELYIRGSKIYRGDNTTRRKGVAILVNSQES